MSVWALLRELNSLGVELVLDAHAFVLHPVGGFHQDLVQEIFVHRSELYEYLLECDVLIAKAEQGLGHNAWRSIHDEMERGWDRWVISTKDLNSYVQLFAWVGAGQRRLGARDVLATTRLKRTGNWLERLSREADLSYWGRVQEHCHRPIVSMLTVNEEMRSWFLEILRPLMPNTSSAHRTRPTGE